MVDPNPPYAADHKDMHETTTERILNGLKYNKTEKVLNPEIYTLGIGDQRWKQ
jgi:hypothetical protein